MTSSRPSIVNTSLSTFAPPPASPQSPRKLRKFQSHQTLTSTSFSTFGQPPATQGVPARQRGALANAAPHDTPSDAQLDSAGRHHSRQRARSNSDTGSSLATPLVTAPPKARRPARKTGSSGYFLKRSGLETFLRDGPADGKLLETLQELRLMVLSNKVDADSDGMSTHRIYLWLVLFAIPPLPTDEYLNLVHRGRSPVYTKIRNDTFRTLATDPLFKRRVTEASLIRLLNAVAWKLHDTQNAKPRSRPSSRRKELLELAIDSPPTIAEEPEGDPGREMSGAIGKGAIYVQGMNVLCAPFLYAARSEVEAFTLFHYFVTKECPGYVRGAMDGVHKGLRLVDRCLEIVDPKLASYLFSKGMQAELYAFPSVLTLCACTPPLPEVLHLWDFLFAYGPHLNILCIVAQLNCMRDAIMQSDSPNKLLRSFPPLEADKIISLTVSFIQKIPDDLYGDLVDHAK
ncbi:putative mitotic check point protein [Talaromyces proteolyticus]|uniref:Mitotic check point protein n=1 Tax=Talaromyces proteolyticus TaxID=1131652 RepID=A0AAD4KVD5_9EURO|nr:putative mitotic check point protein [Talaromyces proteolyticus]KAH8700660.1 putative mitotic check point protein [Talaromyces proteolyticus]